jgi:glycosyltransferase involved in cell wall biosynthesis
VGRLDIQKGHRYFIEAASHLLSQRDEKICFVIAGDGPLKESLRQLARESGNDDAIIFTGHYSNIPLLQSMIDMQVFPSLWEGTPLTVFEAMSMKLPIVSTDVDGLGEVLKNEQNAMVVKSKNPAALAEAMGRLLDDPETAHRLSRQALEDSKKYDIQNSVNRMQEVYDALAQ